LNRHEGKYFFSKKEKKEFFFLHRKKIDEPIMIKRPQIVDTIPTNIRSNIPISPKKDFVNLESKLQRLEQLQYALTKQVIDFLFINT